MEIINRRQRMSSVARKIRREQDKTVGLVPTMGALHEGHLSLVREARRMCDVVVVSVFVNPTQFGPGEDFDRYPRTLAADLEMLAARGADIVFAPEVAEMYGSAHATRVEVDGPALGLEGKFRPGHFSGVATIVLKLFNLVAPDRAYFGQKDAAQVAVLRRLAEDLRLGVEIVVCPIVREEDGLALSSRNAYLSPDERKQALTLSRALRRVEALYKHGERGAEALIAAARVSFVDPAIRIDYIELVDWATLERVATADAGALFAVAAYVGQTRLIDNVILG